MANYNNYADNNSNGQVEFKLVEKLGILERHKSGWSREINLVAWNGGRPKFDIRDWDPDHIRMSRGITLFEDEAIKLTKILAQRLQLDNEEQQMRNSGQAQYYDQRGQNDRQPHYDQRRRNEEQDQYFDQPIENEEQELYADQQMEGEEQELYDDQQEQLDGDFMYYADNQSDASAAQAYAS